MAKQSILLTVGNDVALCIFEQLYNHYPSSLGQLRLVSRQCRDLADSFFFRRIRLYDQDLPPNLNAVNGHIIRRLLDPKDVLSRYVWHFSIDRFFPGTELSTLDSTAIFEQIILNLNGPHTFYLHAAYGMSESTAILIQKKWPQCRLYITNDIYGTERDPLDMFAAVEHHLSAQMHYLDYTASRAWSSSAADPVSEHRKMYTQGFAYLAKFLKRLKNLKVLKVSESGFVLNSSDARGSMNLHLQPGERLPPLEELVFGRGMLDFNREHCVQLRESIDKTTLRRLDLGRRCPHHFLKELKGCFPDLKSLRFAIDIYDADTAYRPSGAVPDYWKNAQCGSVRIIQDFIGSINGLEELTLTEDHQGTFHTFLLPAILKQHGHTLFTLEIENKTNDPQVVWAKDELATLLRHRPYLQRFSGHVRVTHERDAPESLGNHFPDVLGVLVQFRNLRNLKLTITPQSVADATVLAKTTFRSFFLEDSFSRLEDVVVVCWFNREWGHVESETVEVKITRLWADDTTRFPGDYYACSERYPNEARTRALKELASLCCNSRHAGEHGDHSQR
ncbi:hypothetical protein BU16DRAFT_561882 [Lophium mytilinum]|uniref:Uncharacterized protein n=1 Tax=Lophium mytilinum TaxID=390894 RepID=A0A6A6QT71_9PEZI|nr:hypothetical protein BU16DRAFT_561882 [Lophium mytilinum]